MRILGVGGDSKDLSKVFGFSAVYAHYIQRELRALTDFTITGHIDEVRFEQFDHVIGFGLRRFDRKFEPHVVRDIRKRTRGAVAQFDDVPREETTASLMLVCKDAIPRPKKLFTPYHVIGWAADPDLCRSLQSRDEFTILLDHPHYDVAGIDITDEILADVETLKEELLWKGRYGGISVSSLTSPRGGEPPVSFGEICKRYGPAHIFVVTHPESVGLSVIEAAMAGALIVAHDGFIDDSLLSTVRHVGYQRKIPWAEVLAKIDPQASRQMAMKQSWRAVAKRILTALREFRKDGAFGDDPRLCRSGLQSRRPRKPGRAGVVYPQARFCTCRYHLDAAVA